MALSGGAAQAVGIWYQSLGALTSVLEPWRFEGVSSSDTSGSGALLGPSEDIALAVEYFDMDAARVTKSEFELLQFKITSQDDPRGFAVAELHAIFQNATLAILRHRCHGGQPITGFILATNRPAGLAIEALRRDLGEALRALPPEPAVSVLASLPAPEHLFAKATRPKGRRTLRHVALEITRSMHDQDGSSSDERLDACITALARFRFARVMPGVLGPVLVRWFRKWGLLSHEDESYVHRILGALLDPSLAGRARNADEVMRCALEAPGAMRLSPETMWPTVVRELSSRTWPDEPTRDPVGANGFSAWMIDRTGLLRGLPGGPIEPSPAFGSATRPSEEARIIALVGDGGVGKTALLARLFADVAGAIWDWRTRRVHVDGRFRGYPMIVEANAAALENVGSILARWAGRAHALSDPVGRCHAASGSPEDGPALWLGLDGLDELPQDHLVPLATAIASYADAHRAVRVVFTCRRDHFTTIRPTLEGKGLLREIPVEDFTADEASTAILSATNGEIELGGASLGPAGFGMAGERELTKAFEESCRDPLFVGVVRGLYTQPDGAQRIEAAHRGDPDGWRTVAGAYIHVLCARTSRRLRTPPVDARGILHALKLLASKTRQPDVATKADWEHVCLSALDDHVRWNDLYAQCTSSGLIRRLGAGAFEWRHPFIAEHLPLVQEDPTWR